LTGQQFGVSDNKDLTGTFIEEEISGLLTHGSGSAGMQCEFWYMDKSSDVVSMNIWYKEG